MKNYELNLTFKNHEEMEQWEQNNCPNGTYKGEFIMMMSKESSVFNDEIKLLSITTI